MLHDATKSIFLISSFKYLKYIEKINYKNSPTDIIIISDDTNTESNLKNFFKDNNFQVNSTDDMINAFASSKAINEEFISSFKDAFLMFDYENMMILMVDDSELLYTLPVSNDSLTAINTKNKAINMMMKIGLMDIKHLLSKKS